MVGMPLLVPLPASLGNSPPCGWRAPPGAPGGATHPTLFPDLLPSCTGLGRCEQEIISSRMKRMTSKDNPTMLSPWKQGSSFSHPPHVQSGKRSSFRHEKGYLLTWKNIEYTVPAKRSLKDRLLLHKATVTKTILHKISGLIKPGHVLAIMGPSGLFPLFLKSPEQVVEKAPC